MTRTDGGCGGPLRRKGPHPTFLIGRYVSQPMTVKCDTIRDVRRFLAGCEGVSDEEQFGKRRYWQPPEDFEKRKRETATILLFGLGDSCWTWDTTHDSCADHTGPME